MGVATAPLVSWPAYEEDLTAAPLPPRGCAAAPAAFLAPLPLRPALLLLLLARRLREEAAAEAVGPEASNGGSLLGLKVAHWPFERPSSPAEED